MLLCSAEDSRNLLATSIASQSRKSTKTLKRIAIDQICIARWNICVGDGGNAALVKAWLCWALCQSHLELVNSNLCCIMDSSGLKPAAEVTASPHTVCLMSCWFSIDNGWEDMNPIFPPQLCLSGHSWSEIIVCGSSSQEILSAGSNIPGAPMAHVPSSSSGGGHAQADGPSSFTPTLAAYFDENLIRHIQGWPSENTEKQVPSASLFTSFSLSTFSYQTHTHALWDPQALVFYYLLLRLH